MDWKSAAIGMVIGALLAIVAVVVGALGAQVLTNAGGGVTQTVTVTHPGYQAGNDELPTQETGEPSPNPRGRMLGKTYPAGELSIWQDIDETGTHTPDDIQVTTVKGSATADGEGYYQFTFVDKWPESQYIIRTRLAGTDVYEDKPFDCPVPATEGDLCVVTTNFP